MIRLVVYHPQRLYRECLAEAIRKHSHCEVLHETGDPEEVLATTGQLAPDLVLVDAPDATARELIRALVEDASPGKVVACGFPDEEEAILACVEAGAGAFLARDCSLDEIGEQLLAAHRGELRCPRVSAALLRAASGQTSVSALPSRRYPELTGRENQVAELVEQGLSNKEIAAELGLGVSTVKHHVHSILAKLKVRRRGQVVSRTGS